MTISQLLPTLGEKWAGQVTVSDLSVELVTKSYTKAP